MFWMTGAELIASTKLSMLSSELKTTTHITHNTTKQAHNHHLESFAHTTTMATLENKMVEKRHYHLQNKKLGYLYKFLHPTVSSFKQTELLVPVEKS